jgi:DNA-binding transcriptional ArsR family regulator
MPRARTVSDLDALQALTHPVRLKMLELLREPASGAEVARAMGEARQKVNYHLKELEAAGLVRPVGERRKGALTEQLFEAVAGAYLVSPRVTWSDGRREGALRDQAALAALVDLSERIQRNAAELLDRAAYDGEQISSAVVEAEVSFSDGTARSAFMHDYLEALGDLLRKHGAQKNAGARYRVALAVYPEPEDAQ